jgi:hypothetical protein
MLGKRIPEGYQEEKVIQELLSSKNDIAPRAALLTARWGENFVPESSGFTTRKRCLRSPYNTVESRRD